MVKKERKEFNITVSTSDRKNPKVVIIDFKTYISPEREQETYEDDIRIIRHRINNLIGNKITPSDLFEKDWISNFQIAESWILPNKRSCLTGQFLFKQKRNQIRPSAVIIKESEPFLDNIFDDISNIMETVGFKLAKTRK